MDYTNLKEKMEKSISVYAEKLAEVRAGRANPAILNKVKIDYYGTPTPINQVAGVSVPEARLIVIQPWDASVLKEIEVAIYGKISASFPLSPKKTLILYTGNSRINGDIDNPIIKKPYSIFLIFSFLNSILARTKELQNVIISSAARETIHTKSVFPYNLGNFSVSSACL